MRKRLTSQTVVSSEHIIKKLEKTLMRLEGSSSQKQKPEKQAA